MSWVLSILIALSVLAFAWTAVSFIVEHPEIVLGGLTILVWVGIVWLVHKLVFG